MYQDIISNLANKCGVPKKGRKKKSLRSKVLSLVQEANSNAPIERHVIPRAALTVMTRAENKFSALSEDSRELGVLREVAKFITAHQDTHKAHEYSVNTDLLPVGHPKSLKNFSATPETVRDRYAQWLASDSSIDSSIKSLVATAHSLEPGSLERQHAFTRLRVTKSVNLPAFFKIDSIPALVAAFSFSGGNSSAARRARVALQWRDRKGRWIEMGRGIDFNFRLPNGDIGSAGGTYVGVNADRGYSTENGKPVANAGLIEIRGNDTIPDGIYSIESANATPVKARISRQALKRAGIKKQPSVRKATAEESTSKNIPNLQDLLNTRVDAPSGWTKQDDNSFISDDDYKLIPNESGYSLHRLDKDGNTGDKVAEVSSWAEAQQRAEEDSPAYDKFKESVGVAQREDADTAKGIQDARAAQQERLAETIFSRRMEGESLEDVAKDLGLTRAQVRKIESDYARANPDKARVPSQEEAPQAESDDKDALPSGVSESGELPNGITYTATKDRIAVGVFPGREPGRINGVRVKLSGNTFPQKDLIKNLGFKWNAADRVWSKDFIDGNLFGHQKNINAIKEQLDGIGGGEVPRFAGDNSKAESFMQEASNEMIMLSRESNDADKKIIESASKFIREARAGIDNRLKNDIPNNQDDRISARKKLDDFISALEADNFPESERTEDAKGLARQAAELLDESIGTPDSVPPAPPAPPAPPSRYTGPFSNSDDFGKDITDTVVDGAESEFDMSKELEEVLDDDASDVGESIVEQMWDAADSRFDMQDQFDNNFSSTANKEDFIQAAVDSLKGQLSDILEGAYSERRDLEDDDELEIDFDEDAFMDAAEKKYRQLLSDLWDARDEGPDEPPTPSEGDGGTPQTDGKQYAVDFALDPEEYDTIGLDPDKEYTDAQIAEAWISAKGLDGKVKFVSADNPSGMWPEYTFTIPEENKDAFAEAYGYDSWNDLNEDQQFDEQSTPESNQSTIAGKEYTVDFALDPDSYDEIGLDPEKEYTEQQVADAWIESKGLEGQIEFVKANNPSGMWPEFTFKIPEGSKDAFAKAYGYDSWSDLDDDQQFEDGDGSNPDEPPTPPSGGTPPKTPSPSTPSAPSLYKEFDVPNGAFELRGVDYEPEGRIDEESTDFTDDPERLATKYALPDLTSALTQALIGDKDDAVVAQIVDSSVGDDEESLDLEEVDDVVDTPAVQAGRANGTGAGQLEFNKGAEFVPAEALYNAIFLAGGDPNRVIANAYDAVNGNRNNLDKLHNAAGGVPDAEEVQLIDDIFEEIKQIKDASTPSELEQKAANPIDGVEEEEPLPGELLYNIPINFDNPDYYDIDTDPYPPMRKEPDEFGFTDDPEYIARNFAEADLLEQFKISITDGSGTVYLIYNSDVPISQGMYEVPIEAVRDALQYQGVNTNDVLERIRDESNDLEEEPEIELTPETVPAAVPNQEGEVPFDTAVEAIRDFYDIQDDESFPDGIKILGYLPSRGTLAYIDPWEEIYVTRENGSITKVNYISESFFTDPSGVGQQAGWRQLTPEETSRVYGAVATPEKEEEEPTSEPTPSEPEAPSAPEATPPAPAAPQYQYPGPREAGYSPNNTTVVRGGAVVGKGARVQATKDGKVGTVTAIQNDPEYLRIKFDDGTVAVRAAAKVRAISNANGAAPQVAQVEPQPGATDIQRRVDAPLTPSARVARSGETVGVSDESTIPDYIKGKTNENAVQSDFAAWGARDSEIAKAARDRISLENLEKEIAEFAQAASGQGGADDIAARAEARARLTAIVADIYGAREGITFGGEMFSLKEGVASVQLYSARNESNKPSPEEILNKEFSYKIDIPFTVRNVSGNQVGDIRRTLTVIKKIDENGNLVVSDSHAKNEYLSLQGRGKKKGFATAFNRYAENWYIANGIKKVKVYAAGGINYQGGFVWALNGFNWDSTTGPGVVISDLERAVNNTEDRDLVNSFAERVRAAKRPDGSYDMTKVPTPLEYALVGWRPGATDWVGKRALIRESWNGVKHLTPSAREQIQAINYTQIKNAERRIESKQNIPNISSDGIAAVESDSFRNDPVISANYSQIRDALRNNRSLAVLSPEAKNQLNAYTAQQLLNKNRSLPLEDVFRLREALGNEYRADCGYSDPFNSAEVLSEFTTSDFANASRDEESSKLKSAGFAVKKLEDVGVNTTFLVTHIASGQRFFVKNDWYSGEYTTTLPGVAELEATTIFRAAGMQGIHEVRVGKKEDELLVMSEAGSIIPLAGSAVNAAVADRRGLIDKNGVSTSVYNPERFVNLMDSPEDLIRMSLFDILANNVDRHDGNYMVAFDQSTGKIRLFPIDNTLGDITKDRDSIEDFLIDPSSFAESDAYKNYMPTLIQAIGKDDLLKVYKNEADKIVKNLADPLYQPKKFEMDKIIEKWGTYDAFKDAVTARLNKLTTPGSQEYKALENALRIGYWS